MARGLILIGLVLVALGVLLYLVPGLFNWFGKLPGDIRIESERSKVFIPITSMLIISLVLSLIFNLFNR